MANKFRGEATITLSDGIPRLLKYDMNSVIALESIMKVPIAEIHAMAVTPGSGRKLELIRAFLFAGLSACQGGDKSLTLESVGALVDLPSLEALGDQITSAFTGSLGPGKKGAAAGLAGGRRGTGRRR